MLQITIQPKELWDDSRQEFIIPSVHKQTLSLEHSLVSISKWESKWHKPFISKDPKTLEETIDYIKCMTMTQNVNPEIYKYLTNDHISKINEYIDNPMTATYINEVKNGGLSREPVTSELIYYWMIALNIPVDFQKWHLNRLITLIKVCNLKNKPPKKMSKGEIMSRNAALNAARRNKLNSKG